MLRRHGRTTALVAALAVLGILTTTGGAVAASLITGRQIKDGTVTTADVRDGSLRSVDLRDGGITGADVRDGSLALQDLSAAARLGLAGSPGDAGLPGPPGLSGYQIVRKSIPIPGGFDGSVTASCPSGLRALSVQGRVTTAELAVRTGLESFSGTVGASNKTTVAQTLVAEVVCVRVAAGAAAAAPAGGVS